MKDRKLQIRNSFAEFLVFTGQAGERTIDARYEDETIWKFLLIILIWYGMTSWKPCLMRHGDQKSANSEQDQLHQ